MKIRNGFKVEIGSEIKYLGGKVYAGEDLKVNKIYKVSNIHQGYKSNWFCIIDDKKDELLITKKESKNFEVIE